LLKSNAGLDLPFIATIFGCGGATAGLLVLLSPAAIGDPSARSIPPPALALFASLVLLRVSVGGACCAGL
jgi:hypothetical protein